MISSRPDGRVVHTPPAREREGLLGYVLRVSEANGYDTPWPIFSLAGMTQGEMKTSIIPIEKLSEVIGRPVDELARLPWHRYPNGTRMSAKATRPQLLRHLLIRYPKICTQCIAESGVVDAAWDLRIMLACPKHGTPMVDLCPACQGKLTWFRPGLDRCRCGQQLVAPEALPYPQHTIDLLQVVYDTLHGLPTNPTPPSGIPACDLHRMGIDDLLRLLTKIGNAVSGTEARGKYAAYAPDRLIRLSQVFSDWPRQFHRFLRSIDPDPDKATLGLARRFYKFYSLIAAAKWTTKEKMVFIRSAFGQYGFYGGTTSGADPRFFLPPTKWQSLRQQGLSPSQMRKQSGESNVPADVVNQRELARRLGVRVATAQSWAKQGVFGLECCDSLTGGQPVYKIPAGLPRKVIEGAMNVREAGKHLGIPISILMRLRRDGYYRVKHVGRNLTQFSKADLEALRNDILAYAPKKFSVVPEGRITLAAIFRMKMRGIENKYEVVRRVLEGTLVPAGRIGNSIGDVVVTVDWIESFRQNMNVHDTISASRTSKIIESDQSVISALVAQGKLQGMYRGRNLYVTSDSIKSFQERYVPCISIAKRLGWGIRRALRFLSEHDVDLLRVSRSDQPTSSGQSFVPREQAERLFGSNEWA